MASQFYVPGPTIIQVSTGGSGIMQFLGFCEGEVKITVGGKYEDVHTDYAGTALPADCQFMGVEAYISFDLARYVETVASALNARLNGGTEGAIAANTIGTLMIQEGLSYRLLLQSAYSGKTGFSTMIPAYNFPTCFVWDNYDVSLSTKVKKPRFVFRAIPAISPTNLTGTLYNSVVTGAVTAS